MAEQLVAAIEASSISSQQPLHAEAQIGPGGLDNEMEMVAHEAVGMDLPASSFTAFAQGLEEQLPIFAIVKNMLQTIPAIHQVINRVRVFDAQFSRQAGQCEAGTMNTSIF